MNERKWNDRGNAKWEMIVRCDGVVEVDFVSVYVDLAMTKATTLLHKNPNVNFRIFY